MEMVIPATWISCAATAFVAIKKIAATRQATQLAQFFVFKVFIIFLFDFLRRRQSFALPAINR